MKRLHKISCLVAILLLSAVTHISAQEGVIDGFKIPEVIKEDSSSYTPKPIMPAIVKNDLTKKKPELYADYVREKGWFKGVNKIDENVAYHRQVNFRFSEMNKAGHWTKIEIVDADLQLKSGSGMALLKPFDSEFQYWANNPERIKDICSIDLEYDSKGEMVTREIAKDYNNQIIYVGSYLYSIDPISNKTTIIVSYTQNDGIAFFNHKEKRSATIRYTYDGENLVSFDLIDASGVRIASNFIKVYDITNYYNRYYLLDSVKYFTAWLFPDEPAEHTEYFKYDDRGNIIYRLDVNQNGDTLFLYQATNTYLMTQDKSGLRSLDSIDSHGNITWSVQMRNGHYITSEAGYNLRRTTYNYYDHKNPNSYHSNTLFLLCYNSVSIYDDWDSEYDMITSEQTIYQLQEEFNTSDSLYSARLYNKEGQYINGFKVKGLPYTQAAQLSPDKFDSLKSSCQTRYPFSYISESGNLLSAIVDNDSANAMIVSITGERAKRLGLQDNDVIAKWDEWEYLYYRETSPEFNRLWLYTILTQNRPKRLTVLRLYEDTIQQVNIDLPKGNLEELQFTLLPGKVSSRVVSVLRDHKSYSWLGFNKVIMAIPSNSYLHKPAIVYAAGHHPAAYFDREKRPDPLREWRSNDNGEVSFSASDQNEKITGWISYDTYCIDYWNGLEKDYIFKVVYITSNEKEQIFTAAYKQWEEMYSNLVREEIELPLLSINKRGYAPYNIMYETILAGGGRLYKRKMSDNLQLKEKSSYSKKYSYKYWEWREFDEKYIKGAKEVYIIPLDYSNEQQTLAFVRYVQKLTLEYYHWEPWLVYKSENSDYYILLSYDPSKIGDKEKKEQGIIEKGTKIFIYDRKRRMAAYIER